MSLSNFKLRLFVLFLVALIQVGARQTRDRFDQDPQCPNANKDLSWFRENAKSLLFMEHLQKRATEEDLYDWSKLTQTDRFRSKLRSLENQFDLPEEIPEDCYEQMPIPQKIAQRISFLEDRLEGCAGSAQRPCTRTLEDEDVDYVGGGHAQRRLSMLQAELLRQRNVIRQLRTSLIQVNQKCEGKNHQKIYSFFVNHSSLDVISDFMTIPERNDQIIESPCNARIEEEEPRVSPLY